MREVFVKTLLMLATYGLEIVECGGTLAKHARAGDRAYASVTLARPEYREQIRRAATILGITDVRFLEFSYGEVSPDVPSKAKLVALVRELRPDMVITQDPEHPNCLVNIADVFEIKERAVAELHGQLRFTAQLFRQRVSEEALRHLLPDYERLQDDPIALGKALHREMHRAYHLYHGIWSHSSLIFAEPFRRLGPLELEMLL